MGPGQPAFLLAGWRYSSTTSGALYAQMVLTSVMLMLPADSLASQVLSPTEQHQVWGMHAMSFPMIHNLIMMSALILYNVVPKSMVAFCSVIL